MKELNEITERIIGAAMQVHSVLGPGLLESAYEACLASELAARQLRFERQKALPLIYRDTKLDCGYRLDFLVETRVVVEVKSVEGVLPVHKAQLLSYLRLANCRIGLLINFNVEHLKQGASRIINTLAFPPLPPFPLR
jgi:GxxExxY protein